MSIKAETTFSLKDQLFNEQTVQQLADAIAAVSPTFAAQEYVARSMAQFPTLELKERIHCLVSTLGDFLPEDFLAAREVLLAALPPPLDPSLSDDDFGEFIWVVPGEFVARHGCREEYLRASLAFLGEATRRFSSESAIRPFLKNYPQQTMAFVHQWVEDDNYHTRRLASEGIRPFLPWAQRVILPLPEIVEVLHRLHADNTRYVTRSVANTLNDISRLDPALAVDTANVWLAAASQHPEELEWMVRHSLRTLVKDNNTAALGLLGYPADPQFSVSGARLNKRVRVGENLHWQAELTSKREQRLRINLRIHFLKANGTHSAKVFAIKDVAMQAGEKTHLEKKIAFKPRTTRVLYPGKHFAELVVNGVTRPKQAFDLVV